MIPIENIYKYEPLQRVTLANGKRHYIDPNGNALTSVTTILGATGDKSALDAWRKRVGDKQADHISAEARGIGTILHNHMESWILGNERPKGTMPIRVMAKAMSDKMIENIEPRISKLWGVEAMLYYPGLYAGTTDLVGYWDGEPAIMDFKNSKKIKKREWIDDYLNQVCAYAISHNELYNTTIRQAVILMVDRELNFQEFVIKGDEFDHYCQKWLERLQTFYKVV